MPEIVAVSPVASGPAFAVRGDANKSVSLIGIEPENYNRVIGLEERIVAGRLRLNAGEAVIGIELAKDLGATVGDKLRLNTNNGANDTLTITGLFDLGNKGVNARNVYVGLRSAKPARSGRRRFQHRSQPARHLRRRRAGPENRCRNRPAGR